MRNKVPRHFLTQTGQARVIASSMCSHLGSRRGDFSGRTQSSTNVPCYFLTDWNDCVSMQITGCRSSTRCRTYYDPLQPAQGIFAMRPSAEVFPGCTVCDWGKSTSASPVCLPCLACHKKWRGTYFAYQPNKRSLFSSVSANTQWPSRGADNIPEGYPGKNWGS